MQEVSSSIDDIAFRVAKDFNAAQKNGKDLTGEIGNDMFLVGLPKIEKSLIDGSNLDVKIDQLESVYKLDNTIELNFDGLSGKTIIIIFIKVIVLI